MRLEIYVSSQNPDYQESLQLAEQAKSIPGLEIALIKLEEAAERHAAPLDEPPTCLLDSQVISMERTSWEGFFKHLRWQAKAHQDADGSAQRAPAAATAAPAAGHNASLMTMDLFADLKEDVIASLYQ